MIKRENKCSDRSNKKCWKDRLDLLVSWDRHRVMVFVYPPQVKLIIISVHKKNCEKVSPKRSLLWGRMLWTCIDRDLYCKG